MATKWRNDRITADEDPETGLRIVDLPRVKGLPNDKRDAVFAFEREHLGTVKAVIRMNKRANGDEVVMPYRLSQALAAASDEVKALYE